jgi:hypothetical protein
MDRTRDLSLSWWAGLLAGFLLTRRPRRPDLDTAPKILSRWPIPPTLGGSVQAR